eukprot:TRINITY_DN30016_c0_g1_i1.p1 TRINITY_DN30016_c0_g1~~TRINITY_DN30016_c0_g1_i1.p1  ORF type:complete len:227 (-),score=51.42 TRINITY_DN30016_c0_g1_i1:7-687(-)
MNEPNLDIDVIVLIGRHKACINNLPVGIGSIIQSKLKEILIEKFIYPNVKYIRLPGVPKMGPEISPIDTMITKCFDEERVTTTQNTVDSPLIPNNPVLPANDGTKNTDPSSNIIPHVEGDINGKSQMKKILFRRHTSSELFEKTTAPSSNFNIPVEDNSVNNLSHTTINTTSLLPLNDSIVSLLPVSLSNSVLVNNPVLPPSSRRERIKERWAEKRMTLVEKLKLM